MQKTSPKKQLLSLFNYLKENPDGNSFDWYKQSNDLEVLDNDDKQKIRSFFSKWRSKQLITFSSGGGMYYNIKFTKQGLESKQIKDVLNDIYIEKAEKEVQIYKINAYLNQVEKTREIINNKTLRDVDRLKAIDLQQKALAQIKGEYAYECLKHIILD